ncbi:hypothetical protein [Halorussus sp. MSC15.2]|uniref:hypothetical protein n=1 Tax=Halorussus sp. MSC15.2 TaxID=2283638 RepID=UPI0013D2F7D4|nr:hypothetical protein [Halorussus sp. MSC15.2]NEU55740.1 hypothetical protein [Halorussus sp. MSC15.2]
MATDEDERRSPDGDHHPAVEEFIRGDPDALPELGDPIGDDWDPLLDGERIRLTGSEE